MEKLAIRKTSNIHRTDFITNLVIGATFTETSKNYERWTSALTIEVLPSLSLEYFELLEKITGFEKLPKNWDSYNADQTSKNSIKISTEVLEFLKNNNILNKDLEVFVFPMRDGGIQFEFESDNFSAELEINPQGDLVFILFNEEGDIVERTPFKSHEISILADLLAQTEYA